LTDKKAHFSREPPLIFYLDDTNATTNIVLDNPNPFGEISGYPLIFILGIVNILILLVKGRKNVLKIRD
jgi:hypothetical protein